MFSLDQRINQTLSLSKILLDLMPMPVAIFDTDLHLLHTNKTFTQWFSLPTLALEDLECIFNKINELMSNELHQILSEVARSLDQNHVKEMMIRTQINHHKTCKTSFKKICFNENIHGVIMFFEDKEYVNESIELYMKQAHLDQLTGARNRFGFYHAFNLLSDHLLNNDFLYAVVVIDIDKLKVCNDTNGHQYGDHLIKNTVNGISNGLRSEDILARWGGDEFIIILTNVFSENHVEKLLQRLLSAVNDYTIQQNTPASLSYGVALWKTHGDTLDKLITHADKAMYQQKQLKNQIIK